MRADKNYNKRDKNSNMKAIKFLFIGILFLTNRTLAQKKVTTHWGFSNIVKEVYFVDAQGVLNGNYKLWSQEGVLYNDYTFLKGEKNGLCIDYSGKRGTNDEFLGIVTLCYGKPMEETMYKNGKKIWHNYYTCIDGKQKLVYKETAVDSKVLSYVSQHSNGRVDEQYNKYSDYESKATGNYKKYFDSGKIQTSGYYKNGTKQGYWFELSASGDTLYSAVYHDDVEMTYNKFNGKRHQSEKNMDTSFNFSTVKYFDTNGRLEKEELYKVYPASRMDVSQEIHKSRWGYYLAQVVNYAPDAKMDTTTFYLVPEIISDRGQKFNYSKDQYGDTIYQTLNEKQYINYQQLLETAAKISNLDNMLSSKEDELKNIYIPESLKDTKPNLYETYDYLNRYYFHNKQKGIDHTIDFLNGQNGMSSYVTDEFPNKVVLDSILHDNKTITQTIMSLKNKQLSLLELQINANNKILEISKLIDTKALEKKLRKLNYPPFEANKILIELGVSQ
jgi:antitoxin component YwqK of YwqJK toxin-antitoxin module